MKLIILPGMDGTGKLLEPFAAVVRNNGIETRILTYPTGQDQSYAKLMNDTVLPALPENEPFVLLAESFSGPIALSLAQRNQPGLKGLVLVVTFADPPESMVLALTGVLPLKQLFSLPVPCWIAHKVMLGKRMPKGDSDTFCQVVREMQPDVLAERFKSVRELRLAHKEIALPALYIRATEDNLLPDNTVDGVKALLPQLEMQDVEGPHLVLDTSPEECAQLTARFIASLQNA